MHVYRIFHLVKNEDLNHHGTLYAGRTAEWFVEAGFIAAAKITNPENIVCLNIHGMKFTQPVLRGEIICLESRIVLAGHTSLVAHVQALRDERPILNGFITFIHVDDEGAPIPHNVQIEAQTDEERELQAVARQLHH